MKIQVESSRGVMREKGYGEVVDIKEYAFWRFFLKVRDIEGGHTLTDREIDLLAAILTLPFGVDIFDMKYSRKVKVLTGIDATNLTKYKKALVVKGYLTEDMELEPRLANLQKSAKMGGDISLMYKFRFAND